MKKSFVILIIGLILLNGCGQQELKSETNSQEDSTKETVKDYTFIQTITFEDENSTMKIVKNKITKLTYLILKSNQSGILSFSSSSISFNTNKPRGFFFPKILLNLGKSSLILLILFWFIPKISLFFTITFIKSLHSRLSNWVREAVIFLLDGAKVKQISLFSVNLKPLIITYKLYFFIVNSKFYILFKLY